MMDARVVIDVFDQGSLSKNADPRDEAVNAACHDERNQLAVVH